MRLSKFYYFLIITTILTTEKNIIYFNSHNRLVIGSYLILVLIPLILLIKNVYSNNIRVLDNQVPRFIYWVIEVLLSVVMVAQITYLIDSLSWLITGNAAVVTNISSFGFWFVAIIFLVCGYNLQNYQGLIKFCAGLLSVFNIVVVPLLLLYVISSSYGGLLSDNMIGYAEATFVQLLHTLPLLSVLLFVRSKPEEEQRISKVLWSSFVWMLAMIGLTIVMIDSVTTNDIASSHNYLLTLIDNLQQSNVINVYSLDFTMGIALYQFMNSVLILLLLVQIRKAIIKKKFVYARKSQYLQTDEAQSAYQSKKVQQNILVFAILMGIVVKLATDLAHLTLLVSKASIISVVILNCLFVTILTLTVFKSKTEKKSLKLLSLYNAMVAIMIVIVYVI